MGDFNNGSITILLFYIRGTVKLTFHIPESIWRCNFSFSRHDLLKNKTLHEHSTIVLPKDMLIIMEGQREARFIKSVGMILDISTINWNDMFWNSFKNSSADLPVVSCFWCGWWLRFSTRAEKQLNCIVCTSCLMQTCLFRDDSGLPGSGPALWAGVADVIGQP